MKRKRENKIPITLTDRDIAIILSVYENRFLRRDQIQRLYFTDTSLPACNMRLKKLYDHRFLDRLYVPVAVGTAQAVYALDKKGADIVSKTLEIGRSKVKWVREHNRVEFLFLEHTLAVSELKTNLDVSLKKRHKVKLLFYKREDKSLNSRVSDPKRIKKYLSIIPDAFFGIESPKGKSYFFLEADLGTVPLKRFQDKILAYKEYWKSGKYTKTYGFKHFRVLIVAESPKRMANLMEATAEAGGRNMFLFTRFKNIQDNSLFSPIWLSPVIKEPISLLE